MKAKLKSLEYNVTWTCTNSCASCSHCAPVNPRRDINPVVFSRGLELAAKVIEAETFTLLGGEPLLHPEILRLLRLAKDAGVSSCVQLTTNGRLLDYNLKLLPGLLDSLRVTRYPGQVTDEQWKRWHEFCESNRIQFHGGMNAKFYKPISEYELTPEQTQGSFNACPWKSHCTTIDGYRLYLCPQALFFPVHFPAFTEESDSLNLVDATPESVQAYMNRPNALRVCSLCSYSVYAPWREVARADWFKESVAHA